MEIKVNRHSLRNKLKMTFESIITCRNYPHPKYLLVGFQGERVKNNLLIKERTVPSNLEA